eukprot:COSAG05_NODE_6452_length_955_cov_2.123832_1_plen_73_part_10
MIGLVRAPTQRLHASGDFGNHIVALHQRSLIVARFLSIVTRITQNGLPVLGLIWIQEKKLELHACLHLEALLF